MRGFTATDAQEVSPLLSVMTGVTFDVGSPGEEICTSLVGLHTVIDRRPEPPCGVPPAMPNCVRLGLDGHDKVSPKFLLTIALQTVDQMLKNEGTLFSPEQIQLLSTEKRPTVCLDLKGADKYPDAEKAADEAERVKMAQSVFLCLIKGSRMKNKFRDSLDIKSDVFDVLKKPWATMSEFRGALVKVYSACEPSGDYGHLSPDADAEPAYAPEWFVPDNHHVPVKDWMVHDFDEVFTMDGQWPVSEVLTGAWGYNVDRMLKAVQDEADKQGVICTPFPWQCTWKPSTPSGRRPDGFLELSQEEAAAIVQAEMDEHMKYWRVVNLGDLVKSYRVSPQIIHQLQTQAETLIEEAILVEKATDRAGHAKRLAPNEPRDLTELNKPSNDGWYIGSYSQVYVVLEFNEDGTASGLRVAMVPMCLNAKSAEEAERRQTRFWGKVCMDAGCADARKLSVSV